MLDLNYKSLGQGYPIIVLHGLFGTLDNWQTVARRLSENHTVYLVDLRNHGRSPHHSAMNYPIMAEDLRHFMESHGMYQAYLIGHSMGGKVAMEFALEHSDMVEKLMVVDIAPKTYTGGHQAIFEALFSLDLANLEDRQQAEAHLATRIAEPDVRQFLMKNLSRQKGGGFEWKMNLPVIFENYSHILAAVDSSWAYDKPCSFVRGDRSDYIRDEDMDHIRTLFPKAQLHTVKGAGHWVHAEQPEALLQLINTFFEA
ncbi:MAG TPA: alpha/beta fold hydrolase [Saprospiraceae bacterium]|nr:alpha/beta fold hydrolase [Saprospiraceae bacterium]HMQ81610.1 alpha/beta fold hydrolase [Saprospiraceae bacterium]